VVLAFCAVIASSCSDSKVVHRALLFRPPNCVGLLCFFCLSRRPVAGRAVKTVVVVVLVVVVVVNGGFFFRTGARRSPSRKGCEPKEH